MDLDERAHENLVGFVRFLGRLDPTAEVLDEAGVVAVRGATDHPSTRIAVRHGAALPPAEFAARLDDFFFRSGKTACVFARRDCDGALVEQLSASGFVEYSTSPEMVCEHRLDDREPAPGVTVRLGETDADVAAYAAIAANAFRHLGFSEEIMRATLDNPAAMLDPRVAIALADVDGRPVAGACSVLVGDQPEGYVGWVACHDDARGHGLGDVVTRRVTNEAFDRGASIVTLEASRFGESTYARMGYRELYRYATLIKL